MDPAAAATGEARKGGAKRRGVDRSAVRTGSRSLRASTGVARISQTTASASGAKGTPTCGITVAGFQACGHSETDVLCARSNVRSALKRRSVPRLSLRLTVVIAFAPHALTRRSNHGVPPLNTS